MAKPMPKKNKVERTEGALEATVCVRMNSEGLMVDYECGNPECQQQVGETDELEFDKAAKTKIEAGEEATCGACGAVNFSSGFGIQKL